MNDLTEARRIRDEVFPEAFELLSPGMDSASARAQMLATGFQESEFKYRSQVGGPAHGYYQFEQGGGAQGVLRHPLTTGAAHYVCEKRCVKPFAADVYQAIINDDVLATAFARLNYWWLPGRLPRQDESALGWSQYLAAWRPGMPHLEKWANNFNTAWELVLEV